MPRGSVGGGSAEGGEGAGEHGPCISLKMDIFNKGQMQCAKLSSIKNVVPPQAQCERNSQYQVKCSTERKRFFTLERLSTAGPLTPQDSS